MNKEQDLRIALRLVSSSMSNCLQHHYQTELTIKTSTSNNKHNIWQEAAPIRISPKLATSLTDFLRNIREKIISIGRVFEVFSRNYINRKKTRTCGFGRSCCDGCGGNRGGSC